uniref:G-protein coupled receptors family 1 profile domain-containing protein n=1 Tax=Clytia hemisphaerica TaxID=252671 RepID=A0A7M5WMS8_9CNID
MALADEFYVDGSITPIFYIYVIVSFLISTVNIIETIYIIRKPKKTSYEIVLLSLSIADALFCIANLLQPIFGLYNPGDRVLEIVRSLYVVFMMLSFVHLAALAADRLVAIRFPIFHRTHSKPRYAKIMIICIWVILYGIFGVIRATKTMNDGKAYVKNTRIFIFNLTIFADCSLVVIYLIIILHLWRKQKSRQRLTSQISRQQPTDKKLTHYSVLILCASTALSFVFLTVKFTVEVGLVEDLIWPSASASLLLVVNSGMNSFLYFFHNFFKKHNRCKHICRRTDSEMKQTRVTNTK